MLSYELQHNDGRTSFPLVLINWAPTGSEMGMLTLHASALIDFQNTVGAYTYPPFNLQVTNLVCPLILIFN